MKQTITERLRSAFSGLVIIVQVFFFPAAAFAQESTDVPSTESETSQSQPAEDTAAQTGPSSPTGPTEPTGVQQPTGSDSKTYVLNESTGLWENDHYTWDPATGQTKPKNAPEYSYNPTSGMWDTTEWYYSPESGKYLANTVSSAQNPSAGTPNPSGSSITNTGPNSNNTIASGGNTNATFNSFYDASISNKIGQMSQSGNASVFGNTLGGNALSGDASSVANVLSMLQSSWGTLGSEDLAYFMANIDGNLTGDLYVDPSLINAGSGDTNIDVNVSSDAAIQNDIDVAVASGNATVSNNTKGGNATSGNAQAVVNLMNLINSAIHANKSFVGVLNINGNLNGDILLPPEMMQAIIAATGPNSNNQINSGGNTTVNANVNNNQTINNDINADASTGNATVANNTTAGNATTGTANSNVVLLNLTGKKVVAKNAMLVFVNVLGNWVGLIYDAPAGTTAVATTGPGSNNTINNGGNLTVDADIETNSLIDNDVDITATSGNANVSGNTSAGDATSGNASVGVNVLNMIDSEFEVSDWFGVLFINVFGSWVGSFGVNTDAGNQPAQVASATTAEESSSTSAPTAPEAVAQVFRFASTATDNSSPTTSGTVAGATTPFSSEQSSSAAPAPNATTGSSSPTSPSTTAMWLAGIATFIGALMLGGERLISILRSHRVV